MKKVIVTTSWDDGAVEDLRLFELLNKYNLKGTFYIPKSIDFEVKKGKKLQPMAESEIIKIAEKQEVGAHTIRHIYLDKLGEEEIKKEIKESKKWLENLLNKPMRMFSYPGGVFNQTAVQAIRECGFWGARTTQSFQIDIKDPFLMGFSVHCSPAFPVSDDWNRLYQSKMSLKRAILNWKGVVSLKLPITSLFSWTSLVKNIFNYVLENGGVFHLCGHSWEIERYNLWPGLEEIFIYLANRPDISYLTNSETIEKHL